MRILYYDCFAGISGDMNLGALTDLGVDPDFLIAELQKLNIEGFHLEIQKDIRKGISDDMNCVIRKQRWVLYQTGSIQLPWFSLFLIRVNR